MTVKTAAAKVETKEVTSIKKVDQLIRDASKAVGGYRSSIQNAAVAIIVHANEFGDCSRAKVLARTVPARERNSLIGYFALYSPIGVQMGKTVAEDKCRFINDTSKRYNPFNIDAAKANKWYDDPARANPEPKPLDTLGSFYDTLDKMLKSWIAKTEADDDKNKIEPEQRDAVRSQAVVIRKMVTDLRTKAVKHVPAAEANLKQAA